ncbi:hypothetical protein [Burkholderia sp. WAC0059]|nr:hypothetical protein [Burkholderia sp. WAC0059]
MLDESPAKNSGLGADPGKARKNREERAGTRQKRARRRAVPVSLEDRRMV